MSLNSEFEVRKEKLKNMQKKKKLLMQKNSIEI